MPIHHMVLFKFKTSLTAEAKESFLPICREGLAKVPFGTSSAIGPPIIDARAGGYDVGLYRNFKDMEEFGQYRAHPDHMALITGIVTESCESFVSFQIEG